VTGHFSLQHRDLMTSTSQLAIQKGEHNATLWKWFGLRERVQLGGSREEGVCVHFVGKRTGESGPLERGGLLTAAAAAAAGLVQRRQLLLVLHPLHATHLGPNTERREGGLSFSTTIKVAQCPGNSALLSRGYDCSYCTAQTKHQVSARSQTTSTHPKLHPKYWSS
jgi:hypothetical protein